MSALDLRAQLRGGVETARGFLVKDLNALEEDKAAASPGGVARNAIHIVAECAAINRMVANYLQTGAFAQTSDEDRKAYYEGIKTKSDALNVLEAHTQALLAAIDGVDETTLGEVVPDTPLGPMTRFALAQLPAMHMMYHDGQLNYIHTLHGDDKMHW